MNELTFSTPEYDRNEALMSGMIKPEGIKLTCVAMPPQEAHYRMLKNQEYDISDMSISHYIIAKLAGKAPFTAIPVFPMRRFFHVDLAISEESGIQFPVDLKGKKIGVPEYSMSFALWLRGILKHEFGVSPSEMHWFLERSREQRVGESFGFVPPEDVDIRDVPRDKSLVSMLKTGEIDAALPQFKIWQNSRDKSSIGGGGETQGTRFLFGDQKGESIRYFKKTSFFPINHTVVIKDELLRRDPWIARSLFDAFQKSKELSYEKMRSRMREATNYVFLDDLVREVNSIFGEDPYPYGIEMNRKILDAVTTYSYEQGLSSRKAEIADLFVESTLDT